MEKSKSMMVWRTLLVLFIAFLWGGGVGVYAAKKAWVKYDDGTLTFQYGEKTTLDADEYWLNEGTYNPDWIVMQNLIKTVVFDKSFADARPTSCFRWFFNCTYLSAIKGIENLNTSNVTNMEAMFNDCHSLPSLDVSNFNTSNVTNMEYMFGYCFMLTSLDVSNFNTSNVTNMASMFRGCSRLTSLDVSNFNTPNVTNMTSMFSGCSGLPSLDVSNFNTSNVTNMASMFSGCSGLPSLDVSNFNTSNVTNMVSMFRGCSRLTSLDVSNFNTPNVTNMASMFYSCSLLHTIYVSFDFVLTKVSNSDGMFAGCEMLQGEIAFDANYTDMTYAKAEEGYFINKAYIRPWVKCSDGTFTFYCGYKSLLADGEFTLNDAESLPAWNADDFDKSGITKVVFDESFADVRPTSCASWFADFTGLQTVEGLEYLNTSEVTNMNSMFRNCKSLRSLDLNTFDTQQVRDMRYMFAGCTKMETLDLMSFDTQKIYYISFMFYGDGKLKTIYASDKFSLSHLADNKYMNFQNIFTDCVSLAGEVRYNPKWDTGRSFAKTEGGYFLDKQYVRPWVGFADGTLTFNYSYKRLLSYQENYVPYTSGQQWKPGWIRDHSTEIKKVVFDKTFAEARPTYCYGWFSGCENLTEIVGIMYLNTSEVYDMGSMFEGCTALTSLDLSHFDTQKVTEMSKMFYSCSNLAAIYASDKFVLSAVTSDADMFAGCEKLKGDIAFDANSVDKTYAKSKDGYFLNGSGIRPWAKYDGGVLTFYYGYKPELGEGEYVMNTEQDWNNPKWVIDHKADITKVVFDKSFGEARPTTCARWFNVCENLATIEGLEYLNTSEVKSMRYMFQGTSLTTLDLSHFDTSNVTDMSCMFQKCTSLNSLLLSNFNTSNVTNMSYMFAFCESLTSLDISNFDTQNVSDMRHMFSSKNLQTIYASESFVVKEGADNKNMFAGCYNLYGDIAFDANFTDKTYAKLEGGYFTHKEYTRPWVKYADGTLTFRYGYKKELNDYENEYPVEFDNTYPKWVYAHTSYYGGSDDITKAVFDKSFAHYLPTKTDNWLYNCKNMESVEGLENVNTSCLTSIYQMFAGCASLKSLDLSSFNTENVENLSGLFQDCASLETIDLKNFNTQKVSSIYGMFSGCSALKSLDLKNFDTKNVESMSMMFYNCSNLTDLDLGSFDTQKVTDMGSMFSGCSSLKTIDLKNFDTKAVTNMGYMFWRCANLTDLDVSGFDTQLVTDMSAMFSGCSSLKTLDVSKFVTKQVYGMKEMFKDCASLENLDLSNFNPERLGEIKEMFAGCSKLTTLDLSKLNVDGVYETSKMFKDCASLATLTLPNFENAYMGATDEMFAGCSELTYLDLTTLKTENVYDMSRMFAGCSNLSTICASADFVPSEYVTDTEMFNGCVKLQGDIAFDANYIDKTYAKLEGGYFADKAYVRPWVKLADGVLIFQYGYKKTIDKDAKEYELTSTSWRANYDEIVKAVFDKSFAVARPTSCRIWFYDCCNLTEIQGLENLNTSEVTNMLYMFGNCSSLTSLDLSSFDTQNVRSMYSMFYCCSKLTSLDVSSFDTRNVTDMSSMFYGCSSLTSLDVSSFDTQNVTDMNGMFYRCSSLTSLDVSKFDTKNVTTFARMFGNCSSLTSLDLSNFDTQNMKSMGIMFYSTPKLKSIYFGDGFKVDKFESIDHDATFYDCPATLYCSPKQYESFKNNSVIASFGNAVKPYVGINSKSEYGTLCVPVGSSLAAGSFTGFDKLYQVQNADKDKGTITMVEAKRIEPGVPYVYHRYLEGVDFESKTEESSSDNASSDGTSSSESSSQAKAPVMSVITFDVDADASSAVKAPKNEGSLLKGTFESMVALGGSYILQTDGNFHPVAADNTTLKVGAYRAYLDLSSTEVGGGDEGFGDAKAYRMVFEDSEATGIDRINGEGSDKGVYDQADYQPKVYFDLMGRKVAAPQKGEIYIVNGKKVVYNKK